MKLRHAGIKRLTKSRSPGSCGADTVQRGTMGEHTQAIEQGTTFAKEKLARLVANTLWSRYGYNHLGAEHGQADPRCRERRIEVEAKDP